MTFYPEELTTSLQYLHSLSSLLESVLPRSGDPAASSLSPQSAVPDPNIITCAEGVRSSSRSRKHLTSSVTKRFLLGPLSLTQTPSPVRENRRHRSSEKASVLRFFPSSTSPHISRNLSCSVLSPSRKYHHRYERTDGTDRERSRQFFVAPLPLPRSKHLGTSLGKHFPLSPLSPTHTS
jgi:hypothetical protein